MAAARGGVLVWMHGMTRMHGRVRLGGLCVGWLIGYRVAAVARDGSLL